MYLNPIAVPAPQQPKLLTQLKIHLKYHCYQHSLQFIHFLTTNRLGLKTSLIPSPSFIMISFFFSRFIQFPNCTLYEYQKSSHGPAWNILYCHISMNSVMSPTTRIDTVVQVVAAAAVATPMATLSARTLVATVVKVETVATAMAAIQSIVMRTTTTIENMIKHFIKNGIRMVTMWTGTIVMATVTVAAMEANSIVLMVLIVSSIIQSQNII